MNLQGDVLGRVAGLMETGAHEVLKVVGEYESRPKEWLIPFVAALVQTVDLDARRIVVDWGLDY